VVNIAFDPAGDDLAAGVVPLGVHDQRRNQQWLALHLAQHEYLQCGYGGFGNRVIMPQTPPRPHPGWPG